MFGLRVPPTAIRDLIAVFTRDVRGGSVVLRGASATVFAVTSGGAVSLGMGWSL